VGGSNAGACVRRDLAQARRFGVCRRDLTFCAEIKKVDSCLLGQEMLFASLKGKGGGAAVRPSNLAHGKAVINHCFTTYGDEDEIKSCIQLYQGNRSLTDPADPDNGQQWHTLGNTYSMYHQPAQTCIPGPYSCSGIRPTAPSMQPNEQQCVDLHAQIAERQALAGRMLIR